MANKTIKKINDKFETDGNTVAHVSFTKIRGSIMNASTASEMERD